MILNLGSRVLDLSRPQVMGVLNVTPDSFSDGGRFINSDVAVNHAEIMVDEGAAIIDIGGESTRPGAGEVDVQTELDRVIPVIERIRARFDVLISIDTSKPEVMRAATGAGAAIINDVFALQREGALEAAAESQAAVCVMHMQGEPGSMQNDPRYTDVVAEVLEFLDRSAARCLDAGISRDRIVIDPGFGFGKTGAHNLALLSNLRRFTESGFPLLVGLSRKRTLGDLTGKPVEERVAAGVAAAVLAAERGANIIRTHDVAATVDALKVTTAVTNAMASADI